MKKYILFFISIGLLLGIVLVWNTFNIEESKKSTFSESGYILNGETDRYYFYENETYKTFYNNKIVFNDTEGAKVTLDNNSFIHYLSGNIIGLQDGVLLELSKINDDPIVYYNVAVNKEIKRVSNRYIVKNLGKDLQFEQAIWKISQNKYIILGNKIKITLENGTTRDVEGYVEIEYSDNEIISIYNQEVSYKTISSDTYIELDDNIKVNLGTKIVSKKDENKLSLEDMVINSDDNVTLVDLNPEEENTVNEVDENEVDKNETEGSGTTQVASGGGGGGSTSSNTSNSQSQTTINQGTTGNPQTETPEAENSIDIETSNIIYDTSDGSETVVDVTEVKEPIFTLKKMKVTAVSFSGTIHIENDDVLSQDEDIIVKMINNNTGKTVYKKEVNYGTVNIVLDNEDKLESLTPNTSYTIITSATYEVNGVPYTKNFLYKTFVTDDIGIEFEQNGFTDTSLNFKISFTDKLIKKATIYLLDTNGTEIFSREKTSSGDISFDNLESDKNYKIKITDIEYDGVTRSTGSWTLNYGNYKTLKSKASIDVLNYSIDKRNSTFKLIIEQITDKDDSIQNYTYQVFKCNEKENDDGSKSIEIDTSEVVYKKETTSKEITINVGEEETSNQLKKKQYYAFRVIANTFDNEKYVEIKSNETKGYFIITAAEFPTVSFRPDENGITATSISGKICITDIDETVTVDEDNPLIIKYKNNEGEEGILKEIKDITTLNSFKNDGVFEIPISVGGLRANTTYVLSAYGTIDLHETTNLENDEEQDNTGTNPYKNILIGSSRVNTSLYKELTGHFENKTTNLSDTPFSVDFWMDGDEFEKDSLESITFVLQPGSIYSEGNNKNNKTCTINKTNMSKYDSEASSLKELLCNEEKKFNITPGVLFGGSNNDYTEKYYVLMATVTIDGTEYPNKIPITCVENTEAKIGNTIYKNNDEYTAAFIVVNGRETTSPLPTGEIFEITKIENHNASADMYDSKLDSNTIVGYKVKANFPNGGNVDENTDLTIKYYVWNKDGNPVYDGEGNQLIKSVNFKKKDSVPFVTFKLEDGTYLNINDDENGMYRGNSYYFTYEVIYHFDDGDKSYPSSVDPNMDYKSLKSPILSPNKQEPNIIMYPISSDDNSIKYKYSCYDYDKALDYHDEENGESYLELFVGNTKQGEDYIINTNTSDQEVNIQGLEQGTIYVLKYKRILNKSTTIYESKNLVTQKFFGVTNENSIKAISYTAEYNNDSNPNKLKIIFENNALLDLVAGAKVTIDYNGSYETTDLIKLNKDSNRYYIEVDIISLGMMSSIIGHDINISVQLYYDSNKIGFETIQGDEYSVFVNSSNDYKYMSIKNNGTFADTNSIIGSIYKSTFDTNTDSSHARVILNNQKTLELTYSGQGLIYNNNIIVQKKVINTTLNETKIVTINSVIAGIKVNSITTTLKTANISAELTNQTGLEINNITIEVCKLSNKDASPDWNDITEKTVPVNQISNIVIDGLDIATYYKIRFKYTIGDNTYYMYDVEDMVTKKEYEFNTVATIGIKNISVTYEAKSYNEKYFKIKYNINSSVSFMYNKTQYAFYEEDETGDYQLVDLTNENIVDKENTGIYSISQGKLIVENNIYNENNDSSITRTEITEQINVNPANNVFTFGKKYKIVITPIIIDNNEEFEIENVEKILTKLPKKLSEPLISVRLIRQESESDYIIAKINVNDEHHVIVDDNYSIEAYKYPTNSTDQYNENNKQNIYDGLDGNIIDYPINIEQSKNFFAYIKDNINYNENYELIVNYKTNMTNKRMINEETHIDEAIEDKTETRVLQAIENGVYFGTVSAEEGENNKIDIKFYNSYKLNTNNISKIEYTIYNINNFLQITNTWPDEDNNTIIDGESDDTGIPSYRKITLPNQITQDGTYIITLNFYRDNELIGTREVNYTYVNKN